MLYDGGARLLLHKALRGWYYKTMSKKRNRTVASNAHKVKAPIVVPTGTYDVVIIGAGASGLACAISFLGTCGSTPVRVAVLESGKRIGASIMRSGNGRCNFSNSSLDPSRYYHADFVTRVFSALDNDSSVPSVLSWFENLGLVWKEMPGSDGLLYPFSNKANSVLDVLKVAIDDRRVSVFERSTVEQISSSEDLPSTEKAGGFIISGSTQVTPDEIRPFSVSADQVVVASGGSASDVLLSGFDIDCASTIPVLGPLKALLPTGKIKGKGSLEELDGTRMQVGLSVPSEGFVEEGEVLFRSYGISGIVVFNASRYVRPGDEILLDFVPGISSDKLVALFEHRLEILGGCPANRFFTGFFVDPLAHALMDYTGLADKDELAAEDLDTLAEACKAFPLIVEGIADERACQVRRGGVQPSTVDVMTMQISRAPGLYVIGEALDVDGPCGGYNLHWAWTTGLLAGHALGIRYAVEGEDQ